MSAIQLDRATREETARRMANEGARRIRDYVFQMRDNYAADFAIGAERAAHWCNETLMFLNENGILIVPNVGPECAATKLTGDTWRAFELFEAWLLATRMPCRWDHAFKVAVQKAPTPLDVFLMIAIANAFGKSERWLNASEEMLQQVRKAAKSPRPGRVDPMSERVKAIFRKARKRSDTLDQALSGWEKNQIENLRLTYDKESNVYLVDDENDVTETIQSFTKRQLRTIFTKSILPG